LTFNFSLFFLTKKLYKKLKMNTIVQQKESLGGKTIGERRWELLKGVRKSLEDLKSKEPNEEIITRYFYFK